MFEKVGDFILSSSSPLDKGKIPKLKSTVCALFFFIGFLDLYVKETC